MDGEQVAGFLLTKEFEADTTATGIREAYVDTIGTRAAWRGRGIATALLVHALTHYPQHGYRRASLDVDADNPSGALGLYQRHGFEVTQRRTVYAKPI
jgi:ribosomal protein S18 acetylase RimI-like enzyme